MPSNSYIDDRGAEEYYNRRQAEDRARRYGYQVPVEFIYQFTQERDNVPQQAIARNIRAERVSRPSRPEPPQWTLSGIRDGLVVGGYSEWVPEFIVPGPYPNSEITIGAFVTRERFGAKEERIATFVQKFNSRTQEWWLELTNIYNKNEYQSYLRRGRHSEQPFLNAMADAQRREFAREIAGSGPLQLVLAPVADDGELRAALRAATYNPTRATKDKAERAKARMSQFHKVRAQAALQSAPEITPSPESARGQRAMYAAERRRNQRPRPLRGN
jgi:hypothetical protein